MPSMASEGVDSFTIICEDPGKNLWIGLGGPDLAIDSTPDAWILKCEDKQFRTKSGNTNGYGYKALEKDDILECVLD